MCRVDDRQEHLQESIIRLPWTGRNDLHVTRAVWCDESKARAFDDRLDTLAGLKHPIADHCHGQRSDDRTFRPDHGVHPFTDVCVLFEVARVHQVHAAGPGDFTVDHDDLSMQSEIVAAHERSD